MTTPNIYIGIDPGKDGALVALNTNGEVEATFLTGRDFTTTIGKGSKKEYLISRMNYALKCLGGKHKIKLVSIEKQSARPGQGVTSTFSTGYGYGLWLGVLSANGIPFVEVRPKTWVSHVLKDTPGEGKNRSVYVVMNRLPSLDLTPGKRRKPHDGLADAACLAMYAIHLEV
jgi:crossover junction endodeoxyribonuclease RuvC